MRVFRTHAAGSRLKAKSQEPTKTSLAKTRMRLLCLLLWTLPGCLPPPSPTTLPPVESRQVQTRDGYPGPLPERYQVRANDTLYAIAWRFGLDYRALAKNNKISPPYLIQVGRILKLRKPPGEPSPPLVQDRKPPKAATNRTSRPQAQAPSPPPPRKRPPATPREQATSHSLPPPGRWHWPTQGVPVRIDSPVTRSGINIAGRQEQPVWAAAPGKVVYAGDGVLRHGQLILIKHSEELLSAYAHNHKLLIREGQQVQGGEAIAVMGKNPDGKSMLHFEIRRAGQPVDPLRYLRRR